MNLIHRLSFEIQLLSRAMTRSLSMIRSRYVQRRKNENSKKWKRKVSFAERSFLEKRCNVLSMRLPFSALDESLATTQNLLQTLKIFRQTRRLQDFIKTNLFPLLLKLLDNSGRDGKKLKYRNSQSMRSRIWCFIHTSGTKYVSV